MKQRLKICVYIIFVAIIFMSILITGIIWLIVWIVTGFNMFSFFDKKAEKIFKKFDL